MLFQSRVRRLLISSAVALFAVADAAERLPKPPVPEPVEIKELPLPPAISSKEPGACSPEVNPRRTGCVGGPALSFQSGSFLPDGRHVLAMVRFVGAPPAPDPASIYAGSQIILIKADRSRFANGDAWKCVTCGVPAPNAIGMSPALDYPQSFRDGKRALAGTNIIDCSPYPLASEQCTAERTHVYPIRWNTAADGTGRGGSIRELRLHPDNVHLGFSSMTFTHGRLGQFGYIGRLEFNPSPKTGDPQAPRYDLSKVTLLFREGMADRVLTVNPQHLDQLRLNFQGRDVGEFRGFSGDGREAYYVGYPFEACNLDVFAVDLASGKVRRLTSHPEYVDPMDSSPDGKWMVIEDTRGSGRQMFLAGMRGLPPLTDLVTVSAVSSVRNNGDRRFFQPYLLDRYGDRSDYYGQQINAGDGAAGSPSDPNWNAMADPRWSPDGTSVVYWQAHVTSPACGGSNPLPCPVPTEPGDRRFRVMLARFVNRKPVSTPAPPPMPDSVPWGTPYTPGARIPDRTVMPEGTFTLKGAVFGSAKVVIRHTKDHSAVESVNVVYDHYSDVHGIVFDGTESVSEHRTSPATTSLDWNSNIVQSGKVNGTKLTSPDGFKLTIDVMKNKFQASGTLTTTIDGTVYRQPGNGN